MKKSKTPAVLPIEAAARRHAQARSFVAPAILPIEAAAGRFATERSFLATEISKYEQALRSLQARWLPCIKTAAGMAAIAKGNLEQLIKANPALFVEPRTITLHGIKLGFQKGKGQIEWDDADKVVERLKAHFTKQQVEPFLDVKITPRKSALLCVEAGTLKKLGCTITGTEDAVFIKAADSEVDKLVARLLEEGSQKKE